MTLAERIVELEARPWVYSVGTPGLQNGTEVEGFSIYVAKITEVKGTALHAGTVSFKVKDYGTQDEEAYHLDRQHEPAHGGSEMMEWIRAQYTAAVGSFSGLLILQTDDIGQSCYYAILVEDSPGIYVHEIHWTRIGGPDVIVPAIDTSLFEIAKPVEG